MTRRATPPAADVEHVLRPIGLAARKVSRAQDELEALIRAADQAEPRPTNKQIGERAGIGESAVRYMLKQSAHDES